MGEYLLSQKARGQILEIGRFSSRRFGAYQAEAYQSGLERTFQLLADFLKIGVDVNGLLAGGRRFRFQSHLIYYSESREGILIRALFHVSQDIRRELFG